MLSLLSQAVKHSSFLQEWNGECFSNVNGVKVLTSNRLLKAFQNKGIDAMLNTPTLKQLLSYDIQGFNSVMNAGYQFLYQNKVYQLETIKNVNYLTIWFKGSQYLPQVRLSQNLVNRLTKSHELNNDIVDVLNHLIAKGIR